MLQSKRFAVYLSLTAALFMCSACTGISGKQLTADPVYAETGKISTSVSLERAKFSQLKDEYALTRQSIDLDRMETLVRLVRAELERAEYFQQNYRYYRKGLDYERWKSAENTYRLCRKTLCEMMLGTGELHMRHGDKESAAALLNAVISEFEGEDFSGYVDQAKDFLQEIEEARLYAASKKAARQETY